MVYPKSHSEETAQLVPKHRLPYVGGMNLQQWWLSSSVKIVLFFFKNHDKIGTSLAVQWLRLCASTAGGTGSIPGRGTKIPHATWHGQKIKKILKP